MLEWVVNHKETVALFVTYIGGMWGAFKILYKYVYKPIKLFLQRLVRVMSELENNGGGSMKDILWQTKDNVGKIQKDITSIKAAQAANFQLSPDCIFECSIDGKCIMVNESLCRLYGADRQLFLGYGWTNFVVDENDEDDEAVRREAKVFWVSSVMTDNVINSEYTIRNGYTYEKVRCAYTAYVKRNQETGEIISIFGIVNKI